MNDLKHYDVRTQHRFTTECRYFEDLSVGESFYIPSRTITEAHFAAFQMITGDNHPLHYDVEYCRAHGHKNLVAHGLHIMALTASGASIFPHLVDKSIVALLEMTGRMLKPVYVGDTVYPLLTIVEMVRQRTTGVITMRTTVHNQDNELVFDGHNKRLLKLRNPDPK